MQNIVKKNRSGIVRTEINANALICSFSHAHLSRVINGTKAYMLIGLQFYIKYNCIEIDLNESRY